MANLHTPERQPDESQQQYRARRAASNKVARAIARGTPNRGRTVLHKASEVRAERRSMIRAYGRRQGLKNIRYWRSDVPFFDMAAEEPLVEA